MEYFTCDKQTDILTWFCIYE